MKRNSIITGTLVTLAIIFVVLLMIWYTIKPEPVYIQGEVVVKSVKVSSKLSGRVDSLPVKEGQYVYKGQLLFVMSTPEVDAKFRQAEAARSAAVAQQQKADNGARPEEIEAAYNLWQTAQASLELAQKSYTRAQNLYAEGVVAKQALDEAEAAFKAAQSSTAAARSQYEMVMDGARREDKAAAGALVDQASGAVDEVESYIADSHQYAPFDAEIGSIIAEQGELIGSGYPIITLLDYSDMWVSFNIKEDLLPKIQMGTVLTAHVTALDRNVTMKVNYISVQADYATWSATRTKGGFDIRTFEVRAVPENADGLRPGMTVIVNWDEL
ncbi:MAG: efflux RND transporter periplasmic adaptor subunit [Rikenellaceae bacterium]|nr:efflux RND transporter periplasmic adaptor subunit [Rikenellaceae bacterium]